MTRAAPFALLVPLFALTTAAQPPDRGPVEAKHGMVVCVSPPAADVGVEVLRRGGNAVNAVLARGLNRAVADPKTTNAEFKRVYGKNGGSEKWQAGDRLVLKDLGRTLRLVAENGPDVFYTGEPAALLEAEMKAGGGLIT